MNRIQKLIRNNPATMMAAFWPRIGEEQIKCFDRCFREQIANGVTALDVENADVVEMHGFPAGFGDAAHQFFNAKEIALWVLRSQLAQEQAFAAAQIDVQWRLAPEGREKIERSKKRFRDQFDHGTRMEPLRGDSTSQRSEIKASS